MTTGHGQGMPGSMENARIRLRLDADVIVEDTVTFDNDRVVTLWQENTEGITMLPDEADQVAAALALSAALVRDKLAADAKSAAAAIKKRAAAGKKKRRRR